MQRVYFEHYTREIIVCLHIAAAARGANCLQSSKRALRAASSKVIENDQRILTNANPFTPAIPRSLQRYKQRARYTIAVIPIGMDFAYLYVVRAVCVLCVAARECSAYSHTKSQTVGLYAQIFVRTSHSEQ